MPHPAGVRETVLRRECDPRSGNMIGARDSPENEDDIIEGIQTLHI